MKYMFDKCHHIHELRICDYIINCIVYYNGLFNIISLIFCKYFNQNIDALQNSFTNLTGLTFGYFFDQNIDVSQNSFFNLNNFTIVGYNSKIHKYEYIEYNSK